jgi:hypothetical protein
LVLHVFWFSLSGSCFRMVHFSRFTRLTPAQKTRMTGHPFVSQPSRDHVRSRWDNRFLCFCYLGDEGGEEASELAFDAAAYLHDFLVVDGFVEDTSGHVGDYGEAEDFDAHVPGDDDLVDRGHADEISAKGAEGADLGGGLVAWAEDGEIDALVESPGLLGGFGDGQLAQGGGVGRGHVEEA